MKNTTLLCLLLILFAIKLQAQDAYHQSLINDMQADYNLTVNTFYIADNEAAKMTCSPLCDFNAFNQLDIQAQGISAGGFSMGVQVAASPGIDKKPWDYNIRFESQTVPDGEAALLTFWTHGIPNLEGNFGQLEVYVRELGGDNASLLRKFLVLKQEWQQWFLPIEGTGKALRIDLRMGGLEQSLYFGGIALMGGNGFTLSNLPLIDRHDSYDGSDAQAAWRAEAAARIETHRKANLNCLVVDLNGNPIEQAEIVLDMQEHAFAFGVANPAYLMENNPDYKNRLLDLDGNGRGLNTFAFEGGFQWSDWDNPVNVWNVNRTTLLNQVDWLIANNIRPHGHSLLWPNERYLEVEMTESTTVIENAISAHIEDVLLNPGVNGKFISWDVLNEPAYNVVLENKFGFNNVLNLYSDVFTQVANLDPVARRMLNDYVAIGNGSYSRVGIERHKTIVDAIQNNTNNLIQGLGFQCHMRYPVPPEEVWELLNEYNGKADEFIITEFDLKGIDESIQGAYTSDFLTAIFSHEDVSGFTMWNFRDSPGWKHSNTPIFDAGWNIKPSGQAFIDRVFVDWWSNEQEFTGSNGQATIRAFKGTHTVQATYGGMTSEPYEVVLNEDNTLTIILPIVGYEQLCNITTIPEIDGAGEEWFQTSYTINNNVLSGTVNSPGDLSGTFQIQWDNDYLYVFGSIQDDNLINDSAIPYQDDAFEIYIDGGNEKGSTYDENDHQLMFRYNDNDVYYWTDGQVNPAGVNFAQNLTGIGYEMEIRIAWSFIGVSPAEGMPIGIDIHVNDDDDGGDRDKKIAWKASTDEAWNNPALFNTMEFASCNDLADINIEVCVLLEGCYNPPTGLMRNTLETLNLLPFAQPYNQPPWNYNGTETLSASGHVDWVLVSFRTGTDVESQVAQTAGLLQQDGCIYFPNESVLPGDFNTPVYIVVEHRNHLVAMTPQPVNIINNTLTYDFRNADSYIGLGGYGQKQLATGEWCLYAGDIGSGSFRSYDINGADKAIWATANGLFNDYLPADIDLNGDANGGDKAVWVENNGIFSSVPK